MIQREGVDNPERLDFNFLGPPPPYRWIEPILSEALVLSEEPPVSEPEPEFDIGTLEAPGAVVEQSSADALYSDQDQLESMITSLLYEYPIERRASQNLQSILYQQASTFLSLKQAVLHKNYTATTLLDAVQMSDSSLNAVLPVANIRRSVYLEDSNYDTEFIQGRNEQEVFANLLNIATSSFDTTSDARGNRFAKYIHSFLTVGSGFVQGTLPTSYMPIRIVEDQEVFRAPILMEDSRSSTGLVQDLPAGHRIFGTPFKSDMKLKQRYIGPISHHMYRMTGEITMKHPDTGQIIQLANADVLEPLQYLLLPSMIAEQRCTSTRSGVLIWDVRQSENVRSLSHLSTRISESPYVIPVDNSITLSKILEDRLISPFYNFSDASFRSILDSIGFRHLEWTPDIYKSITTSLHKYQKEWNQSYTEAIKRAAESKQNIPILSSIDPSSTLLTSIEPNPLIKEIINNVKQRDATIGSIDVVISESLFTTVHRTIQPLLWSVLANLPEWIQENSLIVESEKMRITTLDQREKDKNKLYTAEPIINSCEHVKELELLRGVEIEDDRMKLLELFHQKYEGGLKGNWIQCNICHQDLICRHEILLLQEYKQDINTQIFHKTLLLEFGDVQYNGSYICKNCGISISDIEYDTNPEFDDEGNLMQGRTVLTDENIITLENLDVTTAIQDTEIKESKITEAKLKIYSVIQILFEYAGANPSDVIYKKCINTIYNQLLVMEIPYKSRLTSILKARTPSDSILVATLVIVLSAAYVIAELQISEKELPIYITMQGCPFSRDGIPRDKEGTGLLTYIACIVSKIGLTGYPWGQAIWSALEGESRRKPIFNEIRYALNEISKIPSLTDALQASQKLKEEELAVLETVSVFRPHIGGPSAITNKEAFQRSILQDPIELIRAEVIGRTEALSQTVIEVAHQHALKTKEGLLWQSKRLNGQCERTKLQEIGPYGFGIVGLQSEGGQQEIQLLRSADHILLQRDPTHSLGLSHFITPWSAPVKAVSMEQNVESLSFRLFLKACVKGPTAGLSHEYGIDRICRRCGMQSPSEILNIAIERDYYLEKEATEKAGKKLDEIREKLQQLDESQDAISKSALEEANIQTDHESFLHLQDLIHLQKKIEPIIKKTSLPWIDQITSLLQEIPVMNEQWNLFTTFFSSTLSEKDRISAFIPLSNLYTSYLRRITNQYITLVGNANRKKAEITMNAFVQHLDTITKDPYQLVRTFLTLFIGPLKRIANGIESSVKGSKWIRSITFEHETLLQEVWKKQYTVIDKSIETIDDHEHEIYKSIIRTALDRYTTLIGQLFEVVFRFVRISNSIRLTEYKDLVRWIFLGSLSMLLDESSIFYEAEGTSLILRQSSAEFIGTTVFQLCESIHSQLQIFQRTPDQIRYAIEARKQQERERFLTKQNKYGDAEKRSDNLMKLFGIGDYSDRTLKNRFAYDADNYEFHRLQRLEYGLPEFSPDISNVEDAFLEGPFVEEGGAFEDYIGSNEQDD
jgi:transcription initiation factor TFIIIB Brf1 subunit/transcription initiation factor TFIIB